MTRAQSAELGAWQELLNALIYAGMPAAIKSHTARCGCEWCLVLSKAKAWALLKKELLDDAAKNPALYPHAAGGGR